MSKIKQWQLFRKQQATLLSKQQILPQDKPLLSLFQNINELPLNRFIDCLVDGNLYSLVKTGEVINYEKLVVIWNNILKEYTDAIGSSEFKLFLSLYKDITLLELKYNSIINVINSIRLIHDLKNLFEKEITEELIQIHDQFANQLNFQLNTKCQFNFYDSTSCRDEIDKCERRSKSIKIRLDLKLISYKAIQGKNNDEIKMDRNYFDSVLITISDHAKYEITENITVSKFCERIKRYNQYCESLKKST